MAHIERLLSQQHIPADSGMGRSLEELLRTDELLSGAESQRLRTYFSSNGLEPTRDLDAFGQAVFFGDLPALKSIYNERLAHFRQLASDEATALSTTTKDIYRKRWGPTRVPVYNLILLSTLVNPSTRTGHLAIARWLIEEVKVPVDGTDLSGSTALHHAISTKPSFDPEYAQMLYDAGGDVNHRNRYGGTPAHEQIMTWDPRNRQVVRRAATALKWFLEHGGNIDIKDTDGTFPRGMVDNTRRLSAGGIRMETWKVVDDEDRRRKRLQGKICTFCGRAPQGEGTLRSCAACKTVQYCSVTCQKGDWPHHKPHCKKVSI
ncbi:hypothetical protein C8Q77DRAFT_1192027 [Trametes polyzona]|nr:hypothetical protein C8Q77DRAFT_1192027 [Trametes polyzona]